jgi:hypothetical protein
MDQSLHQLPDSAHPGSSYEQTLSITTGWGTGGKNDAGRGAYSELWEPPFDEHCVLSFGKLTSRLRIGIALIQ